MTNINIKTNNFWQKYKVGNTNIWFKGYIYNYKLDDIIKISKDINKEKISSFIKSIDGHFALIVQRFDLTFIAVDKIRSAQLFFTKIKNNFFIDFDPKRLVKLSGFIKKINNNAKLELAMSGFTIGNKTIYENLHTLKAGELVLFENNKFEYKHYYRYFGAIKNKNFEEYLKELTDVTLKIFKKMLYQIGDRQIIIPLSGGHDSRLIASILNYLGAKNVKCYSYGTKGNFEAKIAKKVAEKLGFKWKFIPLSYKNEKKFYVSNEYNEYLKFSETFSSVPFIQSLSSIKYLRDMNWINQDAVFINGLSGDFISGGHAKIKGNDINEVLDINKRKENILKQLIEKHFSLWGYLKTSKNLSKIKNNLWNEIKNGCGSLIDNKQDHLFCEYSEFIDRQSKYVIKKQKVYEFYGYEWRLPFWDEQYLQFWQKVPIQFKLDQKLYKSMLRKNNFGGVWSKEFFSDKKFISPKWIIPLRFICKIPFSLFGNLGQKLWKQIDINIFKYHMSIPHTWDMYSYFRVVKDFFKKPRNSVSWQSEDYLRNFESNN